MRGGGITIWSCVGYHGATDVKFANKKLNGKLYYLDEQLMKQMRNYDTIAGKNFIF